MARRATWGAALFGLALGFSSFSAHAAQSTDQPFPIEQARLKNGMQIIVLPNPMVPAVTHMVWYKVGGADDPVGKSGIAHFFEHMMFKATKKHPENAFSQRVAELGGNDNAFTSFDYTAYHQTVAKEHLAEMMQWESERMQSIQFQPADVEKERQVILEERAMRVESNVDGVFAEQMRAALFLNHPFGRPVIGWEDEIRAITAEDLKQFYTHTLKPANAALIVAGDTSLKEVLPLAEKYYGPIQPGIAWNRTSQPEPKPRAARRVEVTHPQATQRVWQRWYLAPSQHYGEKADSYPLSLLAQLLGGGQTSLLYRTLVQEKKLASSASAGYDDVERGPGIFTVRIVPLPNVTEAQITEALEAILHRLRTAPVDAKALERAKKLYVAYAIYAREGLSTLPTLAGTIWANELPISYLQNWTHNIEAVTQAQIQTAAERLFKPEASVTGLLLPTAKPAAQTEAKR